MAKPTTRQELKDYAYRQLGAPVLEINVDDDQADDLLDDAIQYFNERHYNGVEKMYLKHELTSNWYENSNFIPVPDSVIGVEKVFKFDSSTISSGMFSIKYQLFLNDLYQFNSIDLLQYSMVKTYLEDIDFLLTTDKQIRFNQRQDRLYLDIDWGSEEAGQYIVLECYRALDPTAYSQIYNDPWLKKYVTALLKKQWGQNLIKFKGVRLPGGIEFNGREIYDDGQREIDTLLEKMTSEYEVPPLDMIG